MGGYDSGTAIHFVIFAIVFCGVFMFTAWRIVSRLENPKDNEKKDEED